MTEKHLGEKHIHAEIHEVPVHDSIKKTVEEIKPDLFVKTGKTGGKRFVVTVHGADNVPTLIALHL